MTTPLPDPDALSNLRKRAAEETPPSSHRHIRTKTVEATAAELVAASEANPDHPVAKEYLKATEKFRPAMSLFVDQIDLLALLDNKEVIRKEYVDSDTLERYTGKELGRTLGEVTATEALDKLRHKTVNPPKPPVEDSTPPAPVEPTPEPPPAPEEPTPEDSEV